MPKNKISIAIASFLLIVPCSYASTEIKLPIDVERAISKSNIPKDAVSISVKKVITQDTSSRTFKSAEVIDWQEDVGMNPASTMKLLTSLAAMEILGPQYRWKTDIFTNGKIQAETLKGDLLVRGSGDPKLIPEEINKILNNLKDFGIKKIDGDLIFDRSAYDSSVKESSFSDGEIGRAHV